jgi:RNA polymerase sigma-70 factor (ECF subfamily)
LGQIVAWISPRPGEPSTEKNNDVATKVKLEDEDLAWRWASQRDKDSLIELFERQRRWLEPLLIGWLNDDLEAVQDCRQEIFVALLSAIDGFKGKSRFSTWCYRLAKNVCVDYVRRETRLRMRNRAFAARVTEPIPEPGELAEKAESALELRLALERLKASDRALVLLAARPGMDARGIASVYGVSESAARVRLHRARARLRKILEEGRDEQA